MLAMSAHETFNFAACTRDEGKSTVTLPPSCQGMGQDHACVISCAIVRAIDTLTSLLLLTDCEITLLKLLNAAITDLCSTKIWRKYFVNTRNTEVSLNQSKEDSVIIVNKILEAFVFV